MELNHIELADSKIIENKIDIQKKKITFRFEKIYFS